MLYEDPELRPTNKNEFHRPSNKKTSELSCYCIVVLQVKGTGTILLTCITHFTTNHKTFAPFKAHILFCNIVLLPISLTSHKRIIISLVFILQKEHLSFCVLRLL